MTEYEPTEPNDPERSRLLEMLEQEMRSGKIQVPFVIPAGEDELRTINDAVRMLGSHDPETRGRILRYLCDRYGTSVWWNEPMAITDMTLDELAEADDE